MGAGIGVQPAGQRGPAPGHTLLRFAADVVSGRQWSPGADPAPPGAGVEPLALLPVVLAGMGWLVWVAVRPGQAGDRRSSLFVLSALALCPVPAALTLQTGPHLGWGVQRLIPLLALVGASGGRASSPLADDCFAGRPGRPARVPCSRP